MTDAERSDITNGIWLCRNCHKMIDADPARYPAEILFEWCRSHEKAVYASLGKQGVLLELEALSPTIELFKDSTPLAQQIVIDKPDIWEYKLTVELLRNHLSEVDKRRDNLRSGLYSLQGQILATDELRDWYSSSMDEVLRIKDSIMLLATKEMPKALGPSGVSGDATKIHQVCGLLRAACDRLVDWEENVRFSHLGTDFDSAKEMLADVSTNMLDQVKLIERELQNVLNVKPRSGRHEVTLVFELPLGFSKKFPKLWNRALAAREESDQADSEADTDSGCGTFIFAFVAVAIILSFI